MMTAPVLIFGRWGDFFLMWFQQNPFLSHIFSSFFSGGLALTFRIWTLLEIIPRRKRSTMRKYKYINHFLRVLIVIVLSMTQQCVLVNFTMEQWKIDLRKNGSGWGLADPLPHTIQRREARYGKRVLRWQNDIILYLIHFLNVIFLGRTSLIAAMLLFAEHFERPQSWSSKIQQSEPSRLVDLVSYSGEW